MSCFGCCEEDDFLKAAESDGPYVVKNPEQGVHRG